MDISEGALIRRTEGMPETYCGARPKSRAENTRDMTPKKKLIFSRVRTTFADCHAAASDTIRVETYKHLATDSINPQGNIPSASAWRPRAQNSQRGLQGLEASL